MGFGNFFWLQKKKKKNLFLSLMDGHKFKLHQILNRRMPPFKLSENGSHAVCLQETTGLSLSVQWQLSGWWHVNNGFGIKQVKWGIMQVNGWLTNKLVHRKVKEFCWQCSLTVHRKMMTYVNDEFDIKEVWNNAGEWVIYLWERNPLVSPSVLGIPVSDQWGIM